MDFFIPAEVNLLDLDPAPRAVWVPILTSRLLGWCPGSTICSGTSMLSTSFLTKPLINTLSRTQPMSITPSSHASVTCKALLRKKRNLYYIFLVKETNQKSK